MYMRASIWKKIKNTIEMHLMKSCSMSMPLLTLFIVLFTIANSVQVQAKVDTFTYVNQGELGPYVTEYGADYRVLPLFASPFQMAFYNTTPGAFYLALRMGTTRSESLFRWVWEANRGKPVGENATFSLLPDGNLVLAEADKRIVWSTGTANKGVVGLKILPTGNIVLYGSNNRIIWQSFDHPTDTLLVGQSLDYVKGPSKLVSRKSETDGSYGVYSLVFQPGGITLFLNGYLPYYNYSDGILSFAGNPILFEAAPETEDAFAYEIRFASAGHGTTILARPKYNATLSILRLGIDGNLVVYTYYDPVDYRAWEETYALFSDDLARVPGCLLPAKCGTFGACQDEMCVACPSPAGLLGWSKDCAPPQIKGCNAKGKGQTEDYYKVSGIENFVTTYTKGIEKVKLEDCRSKCTMDCKCLGFLYWEKDSKCWLASVLGTLMKVDDLSHVIYVKYLKK